MCARWGALADAAKPADTRESHSPRPPSKAWQNRHKTARRTADRVSKLLHKFRIAAAQSSFVETQRGKILARGGAPKQ